MGKILSDKAIEAAGKFTNGDALVRYFDHGILPGSAFTAILENDLMGVMSKGDSTTIRELPLICSWLYNHAPCDMYGSRESVRRNFE